MLLARAFAFDGGAEVFEGGGWAVDGGDALNVEAAFGEPVEEVEGGVVDGRGQALAAQGEVDEVALEDQFLFGEVGDEHLVGVGAGADVDDFEGLRAVGEGALAAPDELEEGLARGAGLVVGEHLEGGRGHALEVLPVGGRGDDCHVGGDVAAQAARVVVVVVRGRASSDPTAGRPSGSGCAPTSSR